ncbi:hypothetical protein N9383_05245 [Granulosicoccus sp.]|nr:hypothetical protein [Granulosicoccus sp.]
MQIVHRRDHKALSYKIKILIVDEPTAALNDPETTELFLIIGRLKSENVGIFDISHMDELKRIADLEISNLSSGRDFKHSMRPQSSRQQIVNTSAIKTYQVMR